MRLSDKGLDLYGKMKVMFEHHMEERDSSPAIKDPAIKEELQDATKALRNLEQLWTRLLPLGLRGPMNVSAA